MSRRSRTTLAPNLFPFLAVLVCTLGTLILLLALVAQKAETAAQQVADSQDSTTRLRTEEEQWRAQELQKLRARQTAELEERRSALAHLEDHLRRLREELAQLASEAKAAETQTDEANVLQTQRELAELRAEIERAKQEIDDLGRERDGRPPRVVIVPYKGTNGTDRRPIYVECTDQAVIIQPEGVRITAAQLDGPLGPGNPLDAALRAVRAHWQQSGEPQPPYPLLLVRPDGIHAYAACRTAMAAWDDQFGYELIPADLRLGFPQPDPTLRDKLVATVDDAAARQRSKIAAMPARYNGFRHTSAAGGSSRGGDAAGGRAGNTSPGRGSAALGSSGTLEAGSSFGSSVIGESAAEGGMTIGGTGGAGANSLAIGSLVAGGGADGEDGMSGDAGIGGQPGMGGKNTSASGDAGGGSARRGDREEATGDGAPGAEDESGNGDRPGGDEQLGSEPTGGGDAAAGGSSQLTADSAAEHANPLDGGAGRQTQGQIAGSPGSAATSSPPPSGSSAAAGGGAPPAGLSSSLDSSPPPDPHAKTFSESSPPPPRIAPPAGSREASNASDRPVLRAGNDWAMPLSYQRVGSAIVRQMRMHCESGRFILLPESRRSESATVVPIRDGAVEPAVMELATELRNRIESWGPAVQNGRWDPVLTVAVAADAEPQFAELQNLLRGSGIRVEREVAR